MYNLPALESPDALNWHLHMPNAIGKSNFGIKFIVIQIE